MKPPLRHEVMLQVLAICKSATFARMTTGKKLLRYLVSTTLDDQQRSPRIKATMIATEIIASQDQKGDREADPRRLEKADATAKVAVGSLRKELEKYYSIEGAHDQVLITLNKGSYVPVFSYNPEHLSLLLGTGKNIELADIKYLISRRSHYPMDMAIERLYGILEKWDYHPQLAAYGATAVINWTMYDRVFPQSRQDLLEVASSLLEKPQQNGVPPWEYYVVNAWLEAVKNWNWQQADKLFERAIGLSNGEAKFYQNWYATFLASQLRFEEALSILSEAALHNPFDIGTRADLALFQTMAGQLEEASQTLSLIQSSTGIMSRQGKRRQDIKQSRTVFEYPNGKDSDYVQERIAILHEARGEFREAAEVIRDSTCYYSGMGLRYLFFGLARAHGAKLEPKHYEYPPESPLPPPPGLWFSDFSWASSEQHRQAQGSGDSFIRALDAMAACQQPSAVNSLIDAAKDRDPLMILMPVLPFMRHLHGNDEFRRLVTETMGLKFPTKN